MKLEMVKYQLFGSGDSVDVDIAFFVNKLGTTFENLQLAKSLAEQFKRQSNLNKKINPNLAKVVSGQLVGVYKGTVDELNNSLLNTYSLHSQKHELLIQNPLPRDKDLKLLRTVRKTLSFFTRTTHRIEIKKALKEGFRKQIELFNWLDLTKIDQTKDSEQEIWKVILFSVAQVLALESNIELYTKSEISKAFPILEPIMNRQKIGGFEIHNLFLSRLLELSKFKIAKGMKSDFEYEYGMRSK